MNLKKWGSLLTAVAMLGSMAAYAPAAVSAEEASYVMTNEYVVAAAETGTTITTLFSGVLDNGYDDVSYKIEKKTASQAETFILTLSPTTEGAVYTVPDNLISEVAYALIGAAGNTDFNTVAKTAEKIDNIRIVGSAQISKNAFALPTNDFNGDPLSATLKADAAGGVVIDCLATYDAAGAEEDPSFTALDFDTNDVVTTDIVGLTPDYAKISHDMVANKTLHNHKCSDCGIIRNNIDSHTFVAKSGEGKHVCECGREDSYYINSDGTDNGYQSIHDFTLEGGHKCSECGAYNVVAHKTSLKITPSADGKTHSKECTQSGCTYSEAAAAHDWDVTDVKLDAENQVNGKDIPAKSHYCTVCGYVEENPTHEFNYVYRPVKQTDGTYELQIVEADTTKGEVATVCSCGTAKEGHTHTPQVANGFHYCFCGESTGDHVYNMIYDKDTGKLRTTTGGETGVVCACGAIGNHPHCVSDIAQAYTDKANNKHICICGKEVDIHVYDKIDAQKHQHLCVCGAENPDETNGHEYDMKYVQVTGTSSMPVTPYTKATEISIEDNKGVICSACGAVNPTHTKHVYNIYENQKHYCACGKESTEHDYDPETHKCACGKIEGHEHDAYLDDNCDCTYPGCGATDIHTWEPVPGKKYHQCAVCGEKSTNVPSAQVHEYVGVHDAATDTYKHICACGAEDPTHEYGEEGTDQVCICQICGMSRHLEYKDASSSSNAFDNKDITLSADSKSHTCKLCGKTVGHLYDDTYNCEIDGCTSIKAHTPVFHENDSTGNEECICGKETLKHDLTLDTTSVDKHKCANETDTKTPCGYEPKAHTFGNDAVYCADGCGTVNPDVLEPARKWTKNGSDGETDLEKLVSNYRSAYIVSLTKAVNDVLAYDTYYYTDATPGVLSKKTLGSNDVVLLAKTDAQKATFEALMDTFEAVVADKENNGAASSIEVGLVTASNFGAVYALDSNGKQVANNGGTSAAQVGKTGETVKFIAVPEAGYKFKGWYASQTPAADAAPVSTDVILTKAITDGKTSLYAAFEQNTTVQIKLPAGISYKSTITQNVVKDLTNGATPKFVIGEVVYIWPTSLGGKTFQSFTDKYGNAHGYNVKLEDSGYTESESGTVKAYKFEVKAADNIGLNTYAEPSGEYYVVFRNGDKDLAYGETTNKSAASFQPDDPAMEGNTFGGWKYSDDTNTPPTRVQTKLIPKSGILEPIFNKITGLKITIGKGGRFVLGANAVKNSAEGAGFEYGASVALTADEKSGDKFFSGWYINDVLVSKRITEYFTVKDNLTVVPKYEGDEELIAESTYTLTANRSKVSNYQRVVLTGKWAMADEAVRIVDTGFVYSATGKTNLSLDSVDGSDIRMKSTGLTSKSGSFDQTLNLKSTPNATVTAKFYVTFVNANGENETVYTDMVTSKALS